MLRCLQASSMVNKRPDGLVDPRQACEVQSLPGLVHPWLCIPTHLSAAQPCMKWLAHCITRENIERWHWWYSRKLWVEYCFMGVKWFVKGNFAAISGNYTGASGCCGWELKKIVKPSLGVSWVLMGSLPGQAECCCPDLGLMERTGSPSLRAVLAWWPPVSPAENMSFASLVGHNLCNT